MTLDRLTQITASGISSTSPLTGINITGVITATSITATNYGSVNATTINASGVSTFQASSFWGDGDIAYFGDGQDLLIWHNSTDSIIRDNGTGDLLIEGGNRIKMTNPTGIETYAVFNQDGAVELWYDNSKELETTGYGATVFGILQTQGLQVNSGVSTFSGNVTVSSASSITVGSAFIRNNQVGLGATTTTGRNAGVGTATGTIIYNSTTSLLESWNGSEWVSIGGGASNYITATGGNISDFQSGSAFYRTHIFTSTGTFSVTNAPAVNNNVDFMVVGGGGGGSDTGGGGAGGLRTSFPGITNGPGTQPLTEGPIIVKNGDYLIQVGSGGMGSLDDSGGTPGGISAISGLIVCQGGGAGGASQAANAIGRSGGSGGGGSASASGWYQGGTGNRSTQPNWPSMPPGNNSWREPFNEVPRQGNPGGDSAASNYVGGGGGGAGAPGGNVLVPVPSGGVGGIGARFPTSIFAPGVSIGTPGPQPGFYFAGGGGGAHSSVGGAGGSGGGGTGGAGATPGVNGSFATGGGGGGEWGPGAVGGNGGPGIVVLRYQIGSLTASAKATGGAISYAGGKTIHTFLGSGTFTVTSPIPSGVDYLVVAGGGGGSGGGGGGGGFRSGTGLPVSISPGSYPVTVGSGGIGAYPTINASRGTDSVFSTITSTGGGGGSARGVATHPAGPGGSGGGAGQDANTPSVNTGNTPSTTPVQGFNGGSAPSSSYQAAGGGGGAGGAGGNGAQSDIGTNVSTGGAGGIGAVSSISGTSTYYAGGGGGGNNTNSYSTPKLSGLGGLGGGGNGSTQLSEQGTPGQANTGGGGGGGEYEGEFRNGYGGSGIVIIAYPS